MFIVHPQEIQKTKQQEAQEVFLRETSARHAEKQAKIDATKLVKLVT